MPSSNVAIEPLTYALEAAAGGHASHHFGRVSVTRVADDPATERQFALETMLASAALLAEAPLDAIVWNGTSASWRGIERDRELVAALTASIVHTARLDIDDNVAIGKVRGDRLRDLLRAAAHHEPDAIAVVCTNLDATSLAAEMEPLLGCPIVDSIGATVVAARELCGIETRIAGWGEVLALG